jgi:hypothetical protein
LDERSQVNTLPKNKVAGMLGAATAIAGLLLLGAIVVSADPMGRSIGALIGASVLVGFLGTVLGSYARSGSMSRGPRPGPLPQSYPAGPAALATLTAADTTAWAFDEKDADFSIVVSLTEAHAERRRASRERREVATG